MTSASNGQFRIFLVRHAHAAWPAPGTRDFDRPLDGRGRDEAAVLAAMMADNDYQPDRIYCSPAARCEQTLEILRAKLTRSPEITFHHPLYTDNFDTYLALIAANAEPAFGSVMIIGHNPMLEETAHALLLHSGRAATDLLARGFPTAGMLVADNLSTSHPATSGYGDYVGLLDPLDA